MGNGLLNAKEDAAEVFVPQRDASLANHPAQNLQRFLDFILTPNEANDKVWIK
jgi:hypothetical protein